MATLSILIKKKKKNVLNTIRDSDPLKAVAHTRLVTPNRSFIRSFSKRLSFTIPHVKRGQREHIALGLSTLPTSAARGNAYVARAILRRTVSSSARDRSQIRLGFDSGQSRPQTLGRS